MLTLYGIPNCDTCRKARKWLDANDVPHRFHDLRADGLAAVLLRRWAEQAGWKTLLNTRSKTWRDLDAVDRENMDELRAIDLMLRQPTLIKRPVTDDGDRVLVGFSQALYEDFTR